MKTYRQENKIKELEIKIEEMRKSKVIVPAPKNNDKEIDSELGYRRKFYSTIDNCYSDDHSLDDCYNRMKPDQKCLLLAIVETPSEIKNNKYIRGLGYEVLVSLRSSDSFVLVNKKYRGKKIKEVERFVQKRLLSFINTRINELKQL